MAEQSIAKQIAEKLASSRLPAQNGQAVELVVTELREVRPRAGWLRISLTVLDQNDQPARTSLMTGIISGGGRGVMPWLEVRIDPDIEFASGERLDGRVIGLEPALINVIGTLVPAGGHLMIEYESPAQHETHRELLLRVPPAATHLGALMFAAGFRGHFKDWYISEGGHEGPRKLQGNKSPNAAASVQALHANLEELKEFLKRSLPQNAEDAAVIARAQDRARSVLNGFGDAATF
jgi:hypothetical protein